MLYMLKSRGEHSDWRSTKKVPFRQEQILPTKARRPGETSQRMMLQGAMTSPADIPRSLAIQKTDAGLGQMQYANTVRRRAMLKGSAKTGVNQGRINFSRSRLKLE